MRFESKKAPIAKFERLFVSLPEIFNPRFCRYEGYGTRLANSGEIYTLHAELGARGVREFLFSHQMTFGAVVTNTG